MVLLHHYLTIRMMDYVSFIYLTGLIFNLNMLAFDISGIELFTEVDKIDNKLQSVPTSNVL